MAPRLALAVTLSCLLLGIPLRRALRPAPIPSSCRPGPAGRPPHHWLACGAAADPPGRPLADEERLLLGLPLDLNSARPEALAFVPGLSRGLGVAVAADWSSRGRFERVEELRRVPGIGEKRLARARDALFVAPP